jgi:thiamine-phosphate diphosphorylase
MSIADFRVYIVAGFRDDLARAIHSAIRGGVTMVQLRLKDLSDREALTTARPVMGICRETGVPLIVNDRIDLALILGANGVHLGVDDLPLEDARRLAPPGFMIGYSPETDAQIVTASDRGATYLGIGPVYATSTKLDAGEPLGPTEFHRRRSLTNLPVVGIGGITATTARDVIEHGADGVALSSAILGAAHVESAARSVRIAVDQ